MVNAFYKIPIGAKRQRFFLAVARVAAKFQKNRSRFQRAGVRQAQVGAKQPIIFLTPFANPRKPCANFFKPLAKPLAASTNFF
jgi:hypothetical protein